MLHEVEIIAKSEDFIMVGFLDFALLFFKGEQECFVSAGSDYHRCFKPWYAGLDHSICSAVHLRVEEGIFQEARRIKMLFLGSGNSEKFKCDFWMFLMRNFSVVRAWTD